MLIFTIFCTQHRPDEPSYKPRKFLVDVEETMRIVLEQEDTDGNFQIAVTDSGPKVLALGTTASNGYRTFDVSVCAASLPGDDGPLDRRVTYLPLCYHLIPPPSPLASPLPCLISHRPSS